MRMGWVDFSPEARRAADAALNAVSDPGALDELGIGAVRDAFANIFFPGTSTLQTKPKYFVIVPRAVRITLERIMQGKVSDSASNELWRQEYRCADCLWKSVGQKTGSGVIGGTRLGHGWRNWIAGPPSTIYWSGLRTFEIIDAEEGDSLRSEGLSMNLTPLEASWLRERILDSRASRNSLLAICLQKGMRIPKFPGQLSGLESPFEMFCMLVLLSTQE